MMAPVHRDGLGGVSVALPTAHFAKAQVVPEVQPL